MLADSRRRLRIPWKFGTRWKFGLPVVAVMMAIVGATATIASVATSVDSAAARTTLGQDWVEFGPKVNYDRAHLRVTGPGDFLLEQTFDAGDRLRIEATSLPDGVFTYELELARIPLATASQTLDEPDHNGRTSVLIAEGTYSDLVGGTFAISGGTVVQPATEGGEGR